MMAMADTGGFLGTTQLRNRMPSQKWHLPGRQREQHQTLFGGRPGMLTFSGGSHVVAKAIHERDPSQQQAPLG